MSIPSNTEITLPLFERVALDIPEYFVLPSKKKQGEFKLVKGLTPSGKNFTTRQGHKSVKIKQNEKNELYLEEPNYNNPRIEYGMFSSKDQKILNKYFAPVEPVEQEKSPSSAISLISNSTPKYHYEYINGKRHRFLNHNLQDDIIEESKKHRKRRRATNDLKKASKLRRQS